MKKIEDLIMILWNTGIVATAMMLGVMCVLPWSNFLDSIQNIWIPVMVLGVITIILGVIKIRYHHFYKADYIYFLFVLFSTIIAIYQHFREAFN